MMKKSKVKISEIVSLADLKKRKKERIPSASYIFDFLTLGGIPKGRIIEFHGPPSAGKTTFSLLCANNWLERNFSVLFIDLEFAIEPEYLSLLGINEKLEIIYPKNGEEISEILLNSKHNLIILDSVPAIHVEDSTIASSSRLLSDVLKRFIAKNRQQKNPTTLLLINQVRANIGGYISQTEPGGYALKHYSHLRVRFDKSKVDVEKKQHLIHLYIAKSKISPPFQSGELIYNYGIGKIDKGDELFKLGTIFDIIKREDDFIMLNFGEDRAEFKQQHAAKRWIESHFEKVAPIIEEALKKYYSTILGA